MSPEMQELKQALLDQIHHLDYVGVDAIPNIDLYMDQVTTFMEEQLKPVTRHPETDKILTKTMINNYAKNDLLIPPERKKYGMDHMLLLLFIYYFKSFLSIGDIQKLLAPLKENYTESGANKGAATKGKKADDEKTEPGAEVKSIHLADIYTRVFEDLSKQMDDIESDVKKQVEIASTSFEEAPEKEKITLQKFDLICQLSAEVYVKKFLIEKMIDEM